MKGVVYKLDCLETGDVYIGSSVSLRRRIHRGWEGQLPDTFVRSAPKVIEYWEGTDVEELRKREQYHIERNYCCNRIMAWRSHEYAKAQKLAEYHRNKENRQANEKRRLRRFTCEYCKVPMRWDYRHKHYRISQRCKEARKLKEAEQNPTNSLGQKKTQKTQESHTQTAPKPFGS